MSREDQVGRIGPDHVERPLPVSGSVDREAFALEHEAHRFSHRRMILDDQDPRGPRFLRSSSSVGQEPLREGGGLERPQIVGTLTDPHVPHRHAQLLAHREDDALAEPSVFVSTTP